MKPSWYYEHKNENVIVFVKNITGLISNIIDNNTGIFNIIKEIYSKPISFESLI